MNNDQEYQKFLRTLTTHFRIKVFQEYELFSGIHPTKKRVYFEKYSDGTFRIFKIDFTP